jgi:hypothetical protein
MQPMYSSHLHACQSLACIPATCMHSHSLRFFHFMQSYNTYDLSPLLSFLSLAFLPRRTASRRTEHVCIISALRSYTKAPVFTCGNVRKKVHFQTRVQEKKHLGCGKAITFTEFWDLDPSL